MPYTIKRALTAIIICFLVSAAWGDTPEKMSDSSLDFIDRIFSIQLEKLQLLKKMRDLYQNAIPAKEQVKKLTALPLRDAESLFVSQKNDEIYYFSNMKKKIINLDGKYQIYKKRQIRFEKSVSNLNSLWQDLQSRKIMPLLISLNKFVEDYEIHLTLFKNKLEDLVTKNQDLRDRFKDLQMTEKLVLTLRKVKMSAESYMKTRDKQGALWLAEQIRFENPQYISFNSRKQTTMPLSMVYSRAYQENSRITAFLASSFQSLKQNLKELGKMEQSLWTREKFFARFYDFSEPFFRSARSQVVRLEDLLKYALSVPQLQRANDYKSLLLKVQDFQKKLNETHADLRQRIFNLIFKFHATWHESEKSFLKMFDGLLDFYIICFQIVSDNTLNLAHLRRVAFFLPLYTLSMVYEQAIELKNFMTSGGLHTAEKLKKMMSYFSDFRSHKEKFFNGLIKCYRSLRERKFNEDSSRSYLGDILKTYEINETRMLTAKNLFQQVLLKEKSDRVSDRSEFFNAFKLSYLDTLVEMEKTSSIYTVFVDRIKNKRILANFMADGGIINRMKLDTEKLFSKDVTDNKLLDKSRTPELEKKGLPL